MSLSDRKPSKYRHTRFVFHDEDLFSGCSKKIIKCNSGYVGHLTSHLNQNIQRIVNKDLQLQVIKYVAHSHFTHETDRGRHVLCEIGRTWVSAKLCHTEWVLHKKALPDWLRKELYGE